MQNKIHISLKIPLGSRFTSLVGLSSKLLRFEVVQWRQDLMSSNMRATLVFHDLNESTLRKLDELILMAGDECLVT